MLLLFLLLLLLLLQQPEALLARLSGVAGVRCRGVVRGDGSDDVVVILDDADSTTLRNHFDFSWMEGEEEGAESMSESIPAAILS